MNNNKQEYEMTDKELLELADTVEPTVRQRNCEGCGCILIGGPKHGICDDCSTAYREAMRQEDRRAEWHAEMRRDAFGAIDGYVAVEIGRTK